MALASAKRTESDSASSYWLPACAGAARPKASPERGRLLYLFNKASNNINQLAHRANADHLAGVISEATYTRILADLHGLAHYMKAAIKDAG